MTVFCAHLRHRLIETHFNKALNYFLEHPYGRNPSTPTSNQASSSVDEALSKPSTGLLKVEIGLYHMLTSFCSAFEVSWMNSQLHRPLHPSRPR